MNRIRTTRSRTWRWGLLGVAALTALSLGEFAAPVPCEAQFLNQGMRMGSQLTRQSRTRLRQEKQKRGTGPEIEEVVRRLANDRPETRMAAVKSLGEMQNPKVVDYLLNATADSDIRVKVKAIEYLGKMRATDATTALAQQLFLRDVHTGVKKKVLIALGKIGDPRGATPIIEFMSRDLDEPTLGTALFALKEVGTEDVLTFLDEFSRIEESVQLRRLAADAAMDIRTRLSPEFAPVVPSFVKQVELREKMQKGGEG